MRFAFHSFRLELVTYHTARYLTGLFHLWIARKARVMLAVIALMVVHSGFSEDLRRGTEPAADIAFRQFVVPREIEGGVFGKKTIREYGSLS